MLFESLMYKVDEEHTLDVESVYDLIRKTASVDSPPDNILETLKRAGILRILDGTDIVQIDAVVLTFVRGITKETKLELASVLRSRIEQITNSTELLSEGIHDNDQAKMLKAVKEIQDITSTIIMQLMQNRDAILNLVEDARAESSDVSLERRYKNVNDAYEKYVVPMETLIDSREEGLFYHHLDEADLRLREAMERVSIQGELELTKLLLDATYFQVKELLHTGRVISKQCSDIILELRKERRVHNELHRAVTILLGNIRKRGSKNVLTGDIPLWVSRQHNHKDAVDINDEVRTFMVDAKMYKPQSSPFQTTFLNNRQRNSLFITLTTCRKR